MQKTFLLFLTIFLSFILKAQNKIPCVTWEGNYQDKCNPNYRGHVYHTDSFVYLKFWTTNHEIITPGDSLVVDSKFDKSVIFKTAQKKGANLNADIIHYRIDFKEPESEKDTFQFFIILEHSTNKLINDNGLTEIAFKRFKFDLSSGDFISKKREKTEFDVTSKVERLKLNATIFQNVYCEKNKLPGPDDSLMIQQDFWANGKLKEKRTFYDGVFNYNSTSYHFNGKINLDFEGKEEKDKYVNAWDTSGNQIFKDGNGYLKTYYENGQLKSEGFIKNYKHDSTWTHYHPNGKVKSTGIYREEYYSVDKRSKWTHYFANGKLKKEDFIDENKTSFYHYNGTIRLETTGRDFMNRQKYLDAWDLKGEQTCKNGNGYVLNYFENGSLKSRFKILNYLKDTAFHYYKNGNPEKVIKYYNDDNRPSIWIENSYLSAWTKDGKQIITDGTGWINEFSEDSIRTLKLFKNGMLEGKTVSYYKNGRKKQFDTFKENRWIYRVIYYDNGNKYYEFDSKDGPLTYSFTREWWYNGNLKREELDNKTVEYHPNGQLKSFGYYPTDTSKNKYDKDYYLARENWTSYGDEFSYNPFQRKKTWFNNGKLKSEVNFDSESKKLIRIEYFKSGEIKAQGQIKYGDYEFDPDKTIYETDGFTGYLKVGTWNFYNFNGNISKSTNMDLEPLQNRVIGYTGF